MQTLYKKPLTAAHTSVITAFLDSVPTALRDYEPQLVLVSPRTPTGQAPPRFVAPLSPRAATWWADRGEEERREAAKKPENQKKIAGLVRTFSAAVPATGDPAQRAAQGHQGARHAPPLAL